MKHKSFLMLRPASRKDRLFKWNQSFCHTIAAVHFGIIWESVDNIGAAQVLHDRKHDFLL
jgi:hypothetical protein